MTVDRHGKWCYGNGDKHFMINRLDDLNCMCLATKRGLMLLVMRYIMYSTKVLCIFLRQKTKHMQDFH